MYFVNNPLNNADQTEINESDIQVVSLLTGNGGKDKIYIYWACPMTRHTILLTLF